MRIPIPVGFGMLLLACGGDDQSASSCPAPSELLEVVMAPPGVVIDSNGDPNDLESPTFVDRNGDGRFDAADGLDLDMDGALDDFDGDGAPDNRFYFSEQSAWIPDADSFDDFESLADGIPRGVTPVSGACPADGIATGPVDILGDDGAPRFTTWMPSHCCRRAP